jgi:hypothetical protein
VAQRYDFYLRVVKTIFYERPQQVSKILFLTQEDVKVKSSNHRVQKIVKFHAQKETVT